MRSSKKSYTTIGTITLALVFSTTACTINDPSAETSAPSTSATASKSSTATPSPSRTPTVTPSATPSATVAPAPAPAPASPTTEVPPAEAPAPPAPAPAPAPTPAPNPFINPQPAIESFVITAEDAIDIIAEHYQYSPDLKYDATDNGDGTYDVHVTVLSFVAQGGDGDAGTYLVLPDRNFVLK